eukprot:6444244-Prymnesium_polylepis.2
MPAAVRLPHAGSRNSLAVQVPDTLHRARCPRLGPTRKASKRPQCVSESARSVAPRTRKPAPRAALPETPLCPSCSPQVPLASVRLSSIFGAMLARPASAGIAEWALRQPSMEE